MRCHPWRMSCYGWAVFCLLWILLAHDSAFGQKPDSYKEYRDQVFAEIDATELKLDLYVPNQVKNPPTVVWIHGGGWRGGNKRPARLMKVVENGFALASIQYRFTDVAIFPAQIHDCKAAIRWLRANAETYGIDGDWIACAGGSAGGHLALLLGTSAGADDLEGTVGGNSNQSSRVQAVIDYYGPSDFVLRGKTQPERAYTNKSGSLALMGGLSQDEGAGGRLPKTIETQASPITYVSPDDPPLLIFHGDRDEVVLLDQSQAIDRRYRETGLESDFVVVKGKGHGGSAFFSGEYLATAMDFLQRIHERDIAKRSRR